MNAVKNDIEALVQKELKSANEHFPQFHSAHEASSVLREEVEELKEDVSMIKQYFNVLWQYVKRNEADSEYAGDNLDGIRVHAVNAAVEAVQVAAMCDKFKAMLRSDDNA